MARKRLTAQETIDQIASLLRADPAITRKEVADELGRSYRYICQRWADACEAAGVEDVNLVQHQRGTSKGGQDLTSKRFGRLTVLTNLGTNIHGKRYWLCRCDCGREAVRPTDALTSGKTVQCARWDHDILGERYGRLTVEDYAGAGPHGEALYRCRCDCGREITTVGSDIARGHVRSCGCLREDDYVEGTKLSGLDPELRSDSTSGVTGVRPSRGGRWLAEIILAGRHYYLGEYRDIEHAIAVRREAEIALYDPMLAKYGRDPTDEDAWREQVAKALDEIRERHHEDEGPTRSYYAMASGEGDDSIDSYLHVFGSKRARDAWVASPDPAGLTRSAVKATDIRGYGEMVIHTERTRNDTQ